MLRWKSISSYEIDHVQPFAGANVVGRIRFALERYGSSRHSSHVPQLFSLGHFARMNRIATILLLSLTVFLTGCAKPDVKYSDLSPATSATISGDTVTIHLGSDLTASACWTRPKARVEGQTVYVVGYRTLRVQSREFAVRLPASVSSQTVTVVWVDPDGSRVTVPIAK